MAKFPSEEQERFIVRMPDGMREELKAAAASAGRSMNQEIVLRLMLSIGDDVGPEVPIRMPAELQKRIAESAAKHHQSFNEEVMVLLRRAFPEPRTAAEVAYEINEMVEVLQPGASHKEIDALIRKLQQFAYDIGRGHVPVEPEVADEIADLYERHAESDFKERGANYGTAGEDE